MVGCLLARRPVANVADVLVRLVVRNFHMGFIEVDSDDSDDAVTKTAKQIVFLYKLVPGIAARSYGLNVARLAHLPECVIDLAGLKAKEVQEATEEREREGLARRFREVWA